ncbi:MAG: ABC-F family ATP-binding cassette domain-containing protein, partial [Geobacteraceae bacterium]|nr:ABC-F family ATP-binding cassette domain-containing protein [Geobacteraceae bacterium]
MVQITNLCKDFGGRPVFSSVTWRVGKQDRIGLVGENGTGKSTLLKILAGQIEPSSGTIRMAKGCTVGYLPQEGVAVRGKTLFAEVQSALEELEDMEREMVSLTRLLEVSPRDETALERFGRIQEAFRAKGG